MKINFSSESARALRLLDQCPLVITILIHPTLPYPLNVHRFGEGNNEKAVGERGGGMVLFLHQSEPHRLTSPEATFLAAHLACVRMLEIWRFEVERESPGRKDFGVSQFCSQLTGTPPAVPFRLLFRGELGHD